LEIDFTKTSGFARCNSAQALDAAASANSVSFLFADVPVHKIEETGSNVEAKVVKRLVEKLLNDLVEIG
jgi:hypothetical protein